MSVSININGIREPDTKMRDMVELMKQCDKLGIPYPQELEDYFAGTEALDMELPEDAIEAATEVSLQYGLGITDLVEGIVEYGDGAVINLSLLPDDIKKIRIYMS